MAASTREDRALMRVRGAGSRKIPTINFGFNFAFGANAQERQKARTPARSLRSITKTPQSRRSTPRQPSKTPVRSNQERKSVHSIRQASLLRDGIQNAQHTREAGSSVRSERTTKRRRTTPDVETPNNGFSTAISRPAPSTRASRRRTASQMFAIAEDEDAVEARHADQAKDQPPTSPLFVPRRDQQKENDTPLISDSKSDAHVSDLQTTKSGRILLDPSMFPGDTTVESEESSQSENNATPRTVLESPSLHVSEAPSTTRQSRPWRRKPLSLGRRKGRSSTQIPGGTGAEETSAILPSSCHPSSEPSSSLLPLANRISKYSKLASKRTQPASPFTDRERTPQEPEDGDESYVEDSELEPETPAPSKKTRKQPRAQRSSSRSAEPSGRKRGKATFPILTHKLTGVSTLSTINEEDEDLSFADPLSNSDAIPKQPNVVDILAQICRETIHKMIERVDDTTKRSEKATATKKRTALVAFGKDLDNELFTMSQAVEHRIALGARVRKTRREKASLQIEYLEIRKQREQIALQCDGVRRQHWECEEANRRKWTLSEAARRVEQEIERNEASEDEGLEFLLRSVTESVSSASTSGGILDKVKSLNSQLETMALLLEGRHI